MKKTLKRIKRAVNKKRKTFYNVSGVFLLSIRCTATAKNVSLFV